METVALESDGKQVERSRNGTKRLKIVQKAFSHFFVNGVVILPLEERAFLLYAIRPSGRKSGSGPLPGTAAGV